MGDHFFVNGGGTRERLKGEFLGDKERDAVDQVAPREVGDGQNELQNNPPPNLP